MGASLELPGISRKTVRTRAAANYRGNRWRCAAFTALDPLRCLGLFLLSLHVHLHVDGMLDAGPGDGGEVVLHHVTAVEHGSRFDPGQVELLPIPKMLMTIDNGNVVSGVHFGLLLAGFPLAERSCRKMREGQCRCC